MIRTLVVDDSIVFRSQITACLKDIAGVEVVGSAANGKIALQKIEQDSVDLITLDMEMPELDGLGTLREIRRRGLKVKTIVFSSQTARGAEKALEALRLGAHDVIAKPGDDNLNFETASQGIRDALIPRIRQFMIPQLQSVVTEAATTSKTITASVKKDLELFFPKIIVLASSTGGPNALEEIFRNFKGATPKLPLLIVQHMPPVFTQILAKRLSEVSGLDVQEAKNGEFIEPGIIRIAPGDYHMRLEAEGDKVCLKLNQTQMRNSVRPSADELFESACDLYKNKTFGVVLTGMGEDGFVGGRKIRKADGAILIQNKESCVVFGMPGVLFEAEEYDEVGDLTLISKVMKAKFS